MNHGSQDQQLCPQITVHHTNNCDILEGGVGKGEACANQGLSRHWGKRGGNDLKETLHVSEPLWLKKLPFERVVARSKKDINFYQVFHSEVGKITLFRLVVYFFL